MVLVGVGDGATGRSEDGGGLLTAGSSVRVVAMGWVDRSGVTGSGRSVTDSPVDGSTALSGERGAPAIDSGRAGSPSIGCVLTRGSRRALVSAAGAGPSSVP
ncbi:hypothetical protein [Halovivax asiaticus]|uniref:hypothetical protein n=1 Tax=Halovivax asiaticus TaxID=332953 RepID=UPI001F4D1631|nr:hypothetical protein [Halovivax asiaticus]